MDGEKEFGDGKGLGSRGNGGSATVLVGYFLCSAAPPERMRRGSQTTALREGEKVMDSKKEMPDRQSRRGPEGTDLPLKVFVSMTQ